MKIHRVCNPQHGEHIGKVVSHVKVGLEVDEGHRTYLETRRGVITEWRAFSSAGRKANPEMRRELQQWEFQQRFRSRRFGP